MASPNFPVHLQDLKKLPNANQFRLEWGLSSKLLQKNYSNPNVNFYLDDEILEGYSLPEMLHMFEELKTTPHKIMMVTMIDPIYDIIIVGAGPAGLTAGLYAVRNGKTAMILEKDNIGGQMTYSPKIENYPGITQTSGNEIADKMYNQTIEQGVEIGLDNVIDIEKLPNKTFAVYTEYKVTHYARSIILATGVKHRMLGLDHEDEFIGNGISFCAVCDGDFYTDKKVCVIGGGNSALQEAILLAEKCKNVTIIQDLPQLTGETKLQEVLKTKNNVTVYTNMQINNLIINEKDVLQGINITNKKSNENHNIYCDGIFIAIGLIPQNELFAELASLDEYGYFNSNENCKTVTSGLFVAGDCRRKSIRQITTAVADGAIAALNACRYIDYELPNK